MDNQFEYDMDYALKKDRARRKKSAAIKRQRARRVYFIKKVCRVSCIIVLLTIISVIAIKRVSKGSSSSQADNQVLYNDQAAIQINAEALKDLNKETQAVKIKYPDKADNYKEIDNEAILSPYISLLDVENSKIIAGRNCDARIYPASMTKVMTLIVAVENLKDSSQTFTFNNEIIDPLVKQDASRAGFEPDEKVQVEDLLYGLILPSGADSAEALAQMTAGSDEKFADMMNEKCKELGLVNTHFTNPSGLFDEQQYTTPTEMAMILEYAMSNPECSKILSTYQYTTKATDKHPEGIQLTSTMFSRMYGNEVEGVTIQAGKTGYTQEAKSCLVSYAEKNGHHYVAVTASAENKWHVIFDDFEIYKTYLP